MTGPEGVIPLHPAPLGPGVEAWFTGAPVAQPAPGTVERVGNLSTTRPHRPGDVARDRAQVGTATATDPRHWHHMRQVHGHAVGRIDASTPPGAQVRDVDALVTDLTARPLVVEVADCVSVLLAGTRTIAAVHAGRRGVEADVVGAAVARMRTSEGGTAPIAAVIGPAIGGCCYEVPATMRSEVVDVVPAAAATTTWGSPALDLPAAVRTQLSAVGVDAVGRVGGCTRCTPGWFSHRADPDAGRQIGLVVRRDLATTGRDVRTAGRQVAAGSAVA